MLKVYRNDWPRVTQPESNGSAPSGNSMFLDFAARLGSAVTVWGMDWTFRHSTVSTDFLISSRSEIRKSVNTISFNFKVL